MTPLYKNILFWGMGLFISIQSNATPVQVENIVKQGFSNNTDKLLITSQALFKEYERENNITSLIFYSYAMLRLANNYKAVNDYVNASEYAKLGFFYLDEAADLNEDNWRVRYLRARIDAYVAADLGRCVVALNDTNALLNERQKFDIDILARVNHMRYRALESCNDPRTKAFLQQIKKGHPTQIKLLALDKNSAPEWDVNEVSQILMPLMKGE
ncbi:hypothetical protein [Acinetobacter equi]|nr:hypothetical protein [Acinetobacter equi]